MVLSQALFTCTSVSAGHGTRRNVFFLHKYAFASPFRQILGVGLAMTTELIGYFEGEERADKQAEEELPWMSREVLAGAGFGEKSDVYSFGIILWEIMQKEPCLPYAGLGPGEVRVDPCSSLARFEGQLCVR